jgi:hypothetical protein
VPLRRLTANSQVTLLRPALRIDRKITSPQTPLPFGRG